MSLYRIRRIGSSSAHPPAKLILLHGVGSDERDLMGLAPYLPAELEIVCPRAPLGYGTGFAWFPVTWTESGLDRDISDLPQVLASVEELLAEEHERDAPLILGGFSQGGMIALGVLERARVEVAGAVLLSTINVNGPLLLGSLDGLPVFQSHGVFDPILPIQGGRNLRDELINAGCDLHYHEYPMEHTLSEECLRHLNAWLKSQLTR